MAKKPDVIEQLIKDKKDEFEKKYGANFHSMYEFEGIIRATMLSAQNNLKNLKKIHKLLGKYTATQDFEDQLKIEATRVELKDSAVNGIKSLISCAGALDNFNFSEMINSEE